MPQPTIITPDLIAEVKGLRESGLATRTIAEQLGISRNTVGKILFALSYAAGRSGCEHTKGSK